MKLGILLCDHVLPELASVHGTYDSMLTALVKDADSNIDVVVYPVIDNVFPESVDECDAWLSTGSRHGANDTFPWINTLVDFIRDVHASGKRFVGICFGHQVLAKALGGEVIKAPQGWGVGIHEYQPDESAHSLFDLSQDDCVRLVVSHQDQVVALPPHSQRLWHSEFCPNAAFIVDDRMIGIQGHPEFSKPYISDLMAGRRDRIPPAQFEQGIASLSLSADDKRTGAWIVQFLKG